MKNNGHILLHRKFRDWEWYTDINVKTLFIELLFQANWKDNKWKGILIKRGSLLTSLNSLSTSTGLTVKQIRTCLDKLQRTNEVASKSTNRYRIITVLNYDKYQTKGKQDGTPKGSQGATLEELKEIKEYYNKFSNLKNIRGITEKRGVSVKARISDYSLEDVYTMIDNVGSSEFLQGGNDKGWTATFDWCFLPNNFIKVLEGNYNSEVVKEKTAKELYDE
jgi:hypothetical protein